MEKTSGIIENKDETLTLAKWKDEVAAWIIEMENKKAKLI